MRPLSNRLIVSIFPDVTETAGGIVANTAVANHTDRPAWARVEGIGPDVNGIETGDIIMFSRYAGVNLNRTGSRRIMSRDEVMMVAEDADVLRVKLFDEEGGQCLYMGDVHLLPGVEVSLVPEEGATIVGILSEALDPEVLSELQQCDAVVLVLDVGGVSHELKTTSRTLIDGEQFIARGHKVDGAFCKIWDGKLRHPNGYVEAAPAS